MLLGVSPTSEFIRLAKAFTYESDGGDSAEIHPGGGSSEIRKVSGVETRYGLVAILVNSDVWEDTTSYQGLVSGYSASNMRIFERIQRYAEDVQAAIPWTKTLIVKVDANESTVSIQKLLERLYFEGDPNDSDVTRLSGVVIVGDVPLPVVNKSGHRFISMMPYTDFQDPSYVLNETTQDFERNKKASNLQADIWHGVIVPPKTGADGQKMLARYFDKNHSFHSGDSDFATFSKKTYVGDFVTEESTVNNVSFASYNRFLDHWEDIAYYRYTSKMLSDMYAEMLTSVEAGDKVDNDGDGLIDEEAKNGIDDDGDGLADEDVGDGFYNIDNDLDGKIDEDSGQDNNNDKDAEPLYDEEYSDVPFYKDGQSDEDPTGDANGDGCPGVCNKDDNGNSVDHDEDGFPTAMEMHAGWKWNNADSPWTTPKAIAKSFGKGFSTDDEATDFFTNLFVDEDYRDLYEMGLINRVDDSCYDSDGKYHKAWDDDEDGLCDEDGSTETNPKTGQAFNDNDNDGTIDEDPAGMKPTGIFDGLPDIQSKKVFDSLTSRYVEIFQQPIGVWNRIVDATGRWETRKEDSSGNISNDYESSVSLISKKDEATLQYLRSVNDLFEGKVKDMVENLQEEIPIIGYQMLYGTITMEPVDEDHDPVTSDICDPAADNDCKIFVNHSTSDVKTENVFNLSTWPFAPNAEQTYMYGKPLTDIDNVKDCSDLGGSYEENGQFVKYSSLYSTNTADITDDAEMKKYMGCLISNQTRVNDGAQEMCFPAIAQADTALRNGAKLVEDDPTTSDNEVEETWKKSEEGYPACFEFREIQTYQIYNAAYGGNFPTEGFLDKVNNLSKEDSLSEEELNAKIAEYYAEAGGPTLRASFKDVLIYDKDGIKYSLAGLLTDAGYDTSSDDSMDLALAFNDSFKVENPVDGVQEINVQVQRKYLDQNYDILTGGFTTDKSKAKMMSSVYEYIEPRNTTLNIQYADGATPNLPVDQTRRISFMDKAENPQVLKYINLFKDKTVEDVKTQIEKLASSMEAVSGGADDAAKIRKFMDDLNEEQLQDALDWYHMNIDQKHKYLFTNYLGADPAIASKPSDGYEVANIVARGNATQIDFGFNGAKPTEESDLEFLYKSQDAIDAALAADASVEAETYTSLNEEVSNTTPIPLLDWMDEILKWLAEVKDSVSSISTFSGADYCASETTDLASVSAANNTDSDESGIPDVSDGTKTIKLSSEDNSVLQSNGDGIYNVSVSSRKGDGSANAEDSYTQVKLEIVSGEDSIELSGNDTMQLTAGVATFTLKSKDAGNFKIKATAVNRDDLSDSNSLSGTVTEKFVKVTTYTLNNVVASESNETSIGENIIVRDDKKKTVATLNSKTGDLTLSGAEAKVLEADSKNPTRIAIENSTGTIFGVFYLIPATQKVSVGSGLDGVYVNAINGTAVSTTDGVSLEKAGKKIGLVNKIGQIAIADGYNLDFYNPGQINIFDPIKISDSSGSTLFEVTIKLLDKTVSLSKLSYVWPSPRKGRIVPHKNTAYASAVIPDTDADGLDDLEEYAIGTDLEKSDSDGDGYPDGTEVFSGNDPLVAGAKLFTDFGPTNESYADVVKLYLRGVIRGYQDGSFKPDNALSREEFLQVDLGGICVACQKFSDEYKATLLTTYNTDPFPDTDINPELLYCVAEGKTRNIVSGYAAGEDAGYFVPKQFISRAEATKVLVETASLAKASSEGVWYANYVKSAQENHIFPKGRFAEIDDYNAADFSDWFDADQAANGEFKTWIEGYISRAEFAMMAANLIKVKDCRTVDYDGEGLSDTEEDLIYNTDKYASDTDGGGVNDFDEVVRGSDPNLKSDDQAVENAADEVGGATEEDFASQLVGYNHDSGVYGAGSSISYETVTSSIDSSSSEVKVFTNLVPADGESKIYVKAEIRDQSGNVYTDDNSSVIKFVLSSSDYSEIDSDSVKVANGVAETIMTSKTVAGELTIQATISDGSIPSQNNDVRVYAGDPVKTRVSADSSVLPSGGESIDNVRVSLYDSFGNTANYGFHTVTIESEGGIEMMDLYDEDEETEGYQITTSNGFVDFRIKSSLEEDTSVIKASLLDGTAGGSQLKITSLSGMKIQLKTSQPYMVAGSSTSQAVAVRVVDGANRIVSGFQGEINLLPSDDKYGTFDKEVLNLLEGTGIVNISVGTLAGNASLIGTSPGFSAGSTNMTVKPADPYSIQIVKEDGGTEMKAGGQENFYADLYDQYGNLVSNDSTTVIDLRKTDATTSYGTLNTTSVTAKNGRAKFHVTAADGSGVLNLVASSTGLVSGTFGGNINYSMSSDDFSKIEPQGLYTNLLGANYGDVTQKAYIGGYMTFNGRAQVVNTMIASPKPKLELASVDSNGKINLMNGESISQTVMGAGDNLPVKMTWRSFPDDVLQAQIFYVAPSTPNSISASLLSTDSNFNLVQKNSDIYLEEDDAGVAKVRGDGQIELLDSKYNIAVNDSAENLSFTISKTTNAVMQVDFMGDWTSDVTLLSANYDIETYDSLSPGIYLIPTNSNTGNFITMPSGNSSSDPMGLALIDPTEDLSEEMRPSLGYDSLDKAGENGNVGYEGNNKNILLFAAGNTAGESNMYYASEAGILLGDPSVRLQKDNSVNEAGYTEDIGKMVYANGKDIKSLLQLDYNGDNLDDVLIVYDDGTIDVLQNSKSSNRLNNRGTILYVENKIDSVDNGDFNGDDLDDLLIVTKTACLADEMCLYIYENIDGGFVAHNITLPDISSKPKQVKASDLNDDDYTDIVVLDENLNLYVIWNKKGELATVEKINNFGLSAVSDDNLYSDLAVSYSGLDTNTMTLTVPSDTLSGQTYLDDILSNSSLYVENSDVSGTKDLNFEYANKLSALIPVRKTLSDDNGGSVEIGDTLTYTISIKNSLGRSLSDIYIADSVSSRFEFNNSVDCSSCKSASLSETGDSAKPWAYGPISLVDGASATINYKVTVNDLPGMTIMVGNDLYNDYKDDNYPDLGLSPEENNTGTVIVYYSNGSDSSDGYKKINYVEKEYSGAEAETPSTVVSDTVDLKDSDGDNVPDAFEEMDAKKGIKKTDANKTLMETVMHAKDLDGDGWYGHDEVSADDTDLDNDGLNDSVDQWVLSGVSEGASLLLDPGESLNDLQDSINGLDTYVQAGAKIIEDTISTFFCNGGCLAVPSNIAFLAPGDFHVPLTGTTVVPPDKGIPIFGILPAPTPPVVCFGMACYASNIFRLYIAPTTTLGIGVALCVFPYGDTGQCFAFTLPLLQLLGVCDAINGAISTALSTATSFTASADTKVFSASVSASAGGDGGLSSGVFSGYSPPVITNQNIQIPGFPEAFTEWWKKQKYEFFKMLDLPDITFIYPDPDSIKTAFKPDPSQPDLSLKTNILGLQKWLSIANSLPVVNIDPKAVSIKYPALTPEEIELVRKDWEAWLADENAEWDRFTAEFKPQLSAEVYGNLEETWKENIAIMENNLAILEDYSHIPEDLLKIRDLQAYYAKVIICYLDAVLGYTAGYLGTNAERIEAWAEWVGQLKNIIKSWQTIITLSSDFMKSCDKCTNQRFSAFQIIANLFAFLPDIPVIEMPKWPDIVIDVSSIQAGVNIAWPDITFEPETIVIPKIPRVKLPTGSINLDFFVKYDIDLHLPTLPELNLDFQVPELPTLSLPNLPDLPPPPAIPQIDASLKASLDIVSAVLKIICLIRSNFFPVQETKLKTKIEEMTERSSNFLLPSDVEVTVSFPKFSLDFVKEIDIKTYLKVEPDVSAIYDVVNTLAEQSDTFVSKVVSDFNNYSSGLSGSVQSWLDQLGAMNLDVNVDANVSTKTDSSGVSGEATNDSDVKVKTESYIPDSNPASDIAYQYKDEPLVAGNLAILKTTFADLTKKIKDWNDVTPDKYELKGSQTILAENDPLLHRYNEVIKNQDLDSNFLAQIKDSPLANVVTIRDKMIASVQELDKGSEKLKSMNGNNFMKYLAMENESKNQKYNFVSDQEGSIASGDVSDLQKEVDEVKNAKIELSSDDATGITVEAPTAFNDGIYIYNEKLGLSQKLIKYNQESDSAISLLMFDLDNDGDDDIVYSMGGNVYIKENQTKTASVKYFRGSPSVYSLADLEPIAGNVKNLETGDNSYQKASFAFDGNEEAIGYQVLMYDSLDAEEFEPNENVKRMLLLDNSENESEVFVDKDGNEIKAGGALIANSNSAFFQSGDLNELIPANVESTLPTFRKSRLYVKSRSGSAKIMSGYTRTEIDSDGEIKSDDSVRFQTLEDTNIKLTESGKTTSINLPALYTIDLPRGKDRTIRVESGKVLWVDLNSTVDEQDLIKNEEIYAEEVVVLSGSAKTTLSTTEGNELELDKEELFVMDLLANANNPNSEVELENGAYYTNVRALYSNGTSTISDNILLNPQICGDDGSPYPVLSASDIDLAIFTTASVSAANSFDSNSDIGSVYWDSDDTVDSDGNGIKNDDKDLTGETVDIGPYKTSDPRVVTAYISDIAGNVSTATINVNVFIPDLKLTKASSSEVEGSTDPATANLPIHLVRDRNGEITELGNGYTTDSYGNFVANDFDSSNLINVYNQNGDVIAQFNPITKQLVVSNSAYEALALPSGTDWPARLVVSEIATGKIMASFITVSNSVGPVSEVKEDLDSMDLSKTENVTVHVLSDAGNYQATSDGFAAKDEFGVNEMLIRKNGNITMYNARFELKKRETNSLDDYLILDLYDNGVKELEFFTGASGNVSITNNANIGLPASESLIKTSAKETTVAQQYFEDITSDDALFDDIWKMVERGVLAGYSIDGKNYFKPDNNITRAEFTKIILSILCITPSDEAKITPAVFNDILSTADWYFPFTKESFIRDLITGYLGEVDANGQAPFKPNNTITRAEATKIMLEALNMQKIISLPSDLSGEYWYSAYMKIAEDFSPYLTSDKSGGTENYILTADEAADPSHILTRYEFVEMSVRALNAYNCFDIDTDADGLTDFEEENTYKTDPLNPDTDKGGVNDGDEVNRGSDPLNQEDDFPDTNPLDLSSGIYAVEEACNSCPCYSSIDFDGDLQDGDKVFAIIQDESGAVLGKSNEMEITSSTN